MDASPFRLAAPASRTGRRVRAPRRASISIARPKAAESSATSVPTAWILRTTRSEARATTRTKSAEPSTVIVRPLTASGNRPTRISPLTGDRLGNDLALLHRPVGQHRLTGDVADGPHVPHRGVAPLADRDRCAVRGGLPSAAIEMASQDGSTGRPGRWPDSCGAAGGPLVHGHRVVVPNLPSVAIPG